MEPDFSMSSVTIRSILSNKDLLSHPLKATPAGKDDTETSDMYTDATAAFLGPNIWEKTLSDFKMDYLDLDALLGSNPDEGQQKVEDCIQQNSDETVSQIQQLPPQNQPNMCLPGQTSSPPASPDSSLNDLSSDDDGRKAFSVDCKFSPTDLALATPPGQEHYDPTSAVFPEEELKPQPIIKKSRKNFVPDNLKDDKYWARRHKNNIAAKRSREARRLKENQIVLRASYLEKENNSLKEDVMRLKAENDMLKNQLKEYQS